MKEFTIKNLPDYANNYEFIVVYLADGKYCFYGAYLNGFEAEKIALAIDGMIVHNVRIQGKKD